MDSTERSSQSEADHPLARVRILATSDLHMNLVGHNYYSDRPDVRIGFTRTATLIRKAQREAARMGALTLLLDNGDCLQGTPLGDFAADQIAAPHPLPLAFAALGYDAIGLGNHDFGFGLDFLKRVADQFNCPLICSNMRLDDASPIWQSAAVLPRCVTLNGKPEPLNIGILSVLPPQTTQWEAHKLNGQVTATDILTSARDTATELRQRGADLVIALAHSGLGPAEAKPGLENAAIPLASMDEIDAIIAGHTHLTLPGSAHYGRHHVDARNGLVHGKPVVMPGFAGSHLGVIDLTLTRKNIWRIVDRKAELRPIHSPADGSVSGVKEDPEIMALLAKAHAETRQRVARPVGRVDRSLHSYFSFCALDRGLHLLAAAQAAALRPYLRDSQLADLPVLSAVAPAKFGGRAGPAHYTDVPAGEISIRHVADLQVFPNELRGLCVSGAQVLDWLEMSAGVFNQLFPDAPQELHDPDRAGHNLDLLYGIACEIDLSHPARFDAEGQLNDPAHRRIRMASINGLPIDPSQKFVVATNNYRANGGGNFPIAGRAQVIPIPSLPVQNALIDYIKNSARPDPLESAPRPYTFSPLGGAKAILKTGPNARAYIAELAEFATSDLGLDTDGFLRIQLTL